MARGALESLQHESSDPQTGRGKASKHQPKCEIKEFKLNKYLVAVKI